MHRFSMFPGLIYVIVCIQVWMGFPPLYPKHGQTIWSIPTPKEEEILFMMKFGTPAFGASVFAIFVKHPIGMVLATLVGLWCGLKIRSKLRAEIDPLLPSIIHPFPAKWPMFAFDLWTVGVVGFFVLLGFAH